MRDFFRLIYVLKLLISLNIIKYNKIFSKNKVSIKRLVQNPDKNKKSSSIIIITHEAKDKSLKKIINEISKKNYIKRKPKLIRINDK